jgi:oligopeptide transport system substrate-binding protein
MHRKLLIGSVVFILVAGLVLAFGWIAVAGKMSDQADKVLSPQTNGPLSVNLNLAAEPPTLDPSLSSDTTSNSVIDQLFIGLVNQDDETADIQPELATSWTVSPDNTVYTFTLRSDAYWSDGNPVTAADVRYGILRTLDPDTEAPMAYALYVIENAQEFNEGTITDPNLVGVTIVDTTTLRITLEYPASYSLAIFSLSGTRPIPQWTIEAHGVPTWTEVANIVTSGPYRLTEWDHNNHILLEKNPTYSDVSNVQIEQVKMWMVDAITGWQMYLDDELDTVGVPSGTSLDPILRQEVNTAPKACTYYYGFSQSQPPFDDPLVRKAFNAATNRRGLIIDKLDGIPQPALTYTPPGVFGHVDGYTEGVGIPYNPTQAQGWLSDAGYPGGTGLPEITLMHNTSDGHKRIAEYVRDSWYNTLGVSATIQSLPWNDYLDFIRTGSAQIWRLGWCMDYPDANNFLNDGINRNNYGGWNNATYENLLDQAALEQDPNVRKGLYKQAEEILVETDAMMMPLYYYATVAATKPYLERTYSNGGFGDIATWRITIAEETIGTSGGSLTSYDGDTVIEIPAGTFDDDVILSHTPSYGMPPGGDLAGFGLVFDLEAVYAGSGLPASPSQPYQISISYSEDDLGIIPEGTLALYYWDGDQWVKEPTSVVDTDLNIITAMPDHFSNWSTLGEVERTYLPLITR